MTSGQPARDRGEDAATLLAACRDGRGEARAEAFQALGRHMYRVLWPRVQDDPRLTALAEDCVQDALVKVWRSLEAGRGPEQPDRFLSWAARVAANTLVSELRKHDPGAAVAHPKRVGLRRQVSLEELTAPEEGPARELTGPGPTPEEHVVQRELAELLAEIHAHPDISAQSRTVLLNGYLGEWDDDELAAELGTTRANVHVIRSRDLTRLRADGAFMARLAQVLGANGPVTAASPRPTSASESRSMHG